MLILGRGRWVTYTSWLRVGIFSLSQAMAFHNAFHRDGPLITAVDALQSLFSQVQILQAIQMLQDGLPCIKRFRPPRAPGQLFQPILYGLRESYRQHWFVSLLKYRPQRLQSAHATLTSCTDNSLNIIALTPSTYLVCISSDRTREPYNPN